MATAKSLLASLRQGEPPAYVQPLPPPDFALPKAWHDFCSLACTDVDAALKVLLTKGSACAAPSAAEPYLSGPLDRLFKPVPEAARFIAHLFHHISSHSNGAVKLCGSDLFHAHLFVNGEDVGLLFHAKEHPREFTLSSQQITEVGSAASGGARDPRTGTQHSTESPGYAERNFLWLASTHRLYLLMPHEPCFPTADLLSEFAGYQFATVDEAALGMRGAPPLLDVNYLATPHVTTPSVDLDPQHVMCAVYASHAAALLSGGGGDTQTHGESAKVNAVMEDGEPMATAAADAMVATAADAMVETATDTLVATAAADAMAQQPTEEELLEAEAEESVARARRRTHQIDATLRFERLVRGRPSPSVAPSGHWVVLVGGEWGGAMQQDEAKTRPGAWLGSHTSLQAIGRAFAALLPTVGRERIIVIAQLRETLDWLEAACESEQACERITGSARFLGTLRGRLADTRRDCAVLMAHGGADYDGKDVHPASVLHVIAGAAEAADGRPVVPASATSVFVLLNSHGNAHPRFVDRPDAGLDEHYIHFPHPCPEVHESLYDGVAWRGDANVNTTTPFGPKKFRWRLYATQIFQALLQSFSINPGRQVVLLNQSCLSAGHARFLQESPFRQHFSTERWPVCLVSTAGPYETSIADFWDAFLGEWAHAVEVPVERRTIGTIFRNAEAKYYALNRGLKEHNDKARQLAELTRTRSGESSDGDANGLGAAAGGGATAEGGGGGGKAAGSALGGGGDGGGDGGGGGSGDGGVGSDAAAASAASGAASSSGGAAAGAPSSESSGHDSPPAEDLHPLSFGTVHLHEGRAKAGGPMSETTVWDLLLEEAGVGAGAGGTTGRCTPSLCVRCPEKGHAIVTNESVPGKSYPRVRNFGACDVCEARGTTYRCSGGCDYDLCGPCYEGKAAEVEALATAGGTHAGTSAGAMAPVASFAAPSRASSTDFDSHADFELQGQQLPLSFGHEREP